MTFHWTEVNVVYLSLSYQAQGAMIPNDNICDLKKGQSKTQLWEKFSVPDLYCDQITYTCILGYN